MWKLKVTLYEKFISGWNKERYSVSLVEDLNIQQRYSPLVTVCKHRCLFINHSTYILDEAPTAQVSLFRYFEG